MNFRFHLLWDKSEKTEYSVPRKRQWTLLCLNVWCAFIRSNLMITFPSFSVCWKSLCISDTHAHTHAHYITVFTSPLNFLSSNKHTHTHTHTHIFLNTLPSHTHIHTHTHVRVEMLSSWMRQQLLSSRLQGNKNCLAYFMGRLLLSRGTNCASDRGLEFEFCSSIEIRQRRTNKVTYPVFSYEDSRAEKKIWIGATVS